jgi:hypothetical protein
MKVFISWSGERSHKVAEMLHDWLSLVIQALEPWVSSSDIERGAQWNSKINKELEASSQGIFCLTAENKEAPWILFEAGSLAKGQDTSRVYTFLIDLKASEVTGPLVQFNHTQPTKDEMRLLVGSLNERLGNNKLSEAVLGRSFDNAWPKFEKDFKRILAETEASTPVKDKRGDKEILGEILELVRNFDKRVMNLERTTRSLERVTALNVSEIDSTKSFFNKLIEDRVLHVSSKHPVVRPKDSHEVKPDPVLVEIWNSLKEGIDDDDIRGILMSSPFLLSAEEAASRLYMVKEAIQRAN